LLNEAGKPVAIVTGVSGQDGILISQILLREGYRVIGLTRSVSAARKKLNYLNVLDGVQLFETSYSIESLVELLCASNPSVIINLAGQSYVSRSWEVVEETIWSQGVITGNLLDAILKTSQTKIKFLNSTSSEIFDARLEPPYNEESVRKPYNPYGCAQILSSSLVEIFRERYGLFSCNAILFPHESIYRGKDFFFSRITSEIQKISSGEANFLDVGNLETIRDWGSAKEYMEGVYSILALDDPEDFCFATNKPYSVEEIIEIVFTKKKLDYKKYIRQSENLKRYYEPRMIYGDASKAGKILNWRPTLWGGSLVESLMIDFSGGRKS